MYHNFPWWVYFCPTQSAIDFTVHANWCIASLNDMSNIFPCRLEFPPVNVLFLCFLLCMVFLELLLFSFTVLELILSSYLCLFSFSPEATLLLSGRLLVIHFSLFPSFFFFAPDYLVYPVEFGLSCIISMKITLPLCSSLSDTLDSNCLIRLL